VATLLEPAPGVDLALTLATFGTPCGIEGLEKDKFDLLRYAEIIDATRPTVVVECGTWRGASATWFAERVDLVVTIDTDGRQFTAQPRANVITLIGDSTNSGVLAQVAQRVAGRRVMVSLDSDHSRDHVMAEIAHYAELVTPGCYLVVEDAIFHWRAHDYAGDPLEAISLTLPGRADFQRDVDIEARFPVTGSPAGWWRKINAP
jgi:cephalosporin hydroxylase